MPKKSPKPEVKPLRSSPVRISDSALDLARIASGYTKESVAEYVSRVIEETAKRDIDQLHDRFKELEAKPKR